MPAADRRIDHLQRQNGGRVRVGIRTALCNLRRQRFAHQEANEGMRRVEGTGRLAANAGAQEEPPVGISSTQVTRCRVVGHSAISGGMLDRHHHLELRTPQARHRRGRDAGFEFQQRLVDATEFLDIQRTIVHPLALPCPSVSSTAADRAAAQPHAHPTPADRAAVLPARRTARRRVASPTARCTTGHRGSTGTRVAAHPPTCGRCRDRDPAVVAPMAPAPDWATAHRATGRWTQS